MDAGAGKRVGDRGVQLPGIPDFTDGLDGGCQIRAVTGQYRGVGADLRLARRRIPIRTQMIVESPVSHPLPQQQQFQRFARVAAMGHHAVERLELLVGLPPFAIVVSYAHKGAGSNRKSVGPAQSLAGPEAFDFDRGSFRNMPELGSPRSMA